MFGGVSSPAPLPPPPEPSSLADDLLADEQAAEIARKRRMRERGRFGRAALVIDENEQRSGTGLRIID